MGITFLLVFKPTWLSVIKRKKLLCTPSLYECNISIQVQSFKIMSKFHGTLYPYYFSMTFQHELSFGNHGRTIIIKFPSVTWLKEASITWNIIKIYVIQTKMLHYNFLMAVSLRQWRMAIKTVMWHKLDLDNTYIWHVLFINIWFHETGYQISKATVIYQSLRLHEALVTTNMLRNKYYNLKLMTLCA